FRHMCEVELDRPTAARLEVDKQRPALRVEQVARVWLSMQQLLAGGARADLMCLASQRAAEKLPSRVFEPWRSVRARNGLLSSRESVREVRTSQIAPRHTGMQPLERLRVIGWCDLLTYLLVVRPERDHEPAPLIDARLHSGHESRNGGLVLGKHSSNLELGPESLES